MKSSPAHAAFAKVRSDLDRFGFSLTPLQSPFPSYLLQLSIVLLCLSAAVIAIQVHEPLANDDVTTAATTVLTSTVSNSPSTAASTVATPPSDPTTAQTSSPNAVQPPINTTKMPRVVNGYHQSDQQPRSTSHVNTKQFVPSPQLSPMTFPTTGAVSSSSEHGRENVLPLQNLHLHYPAYPASQLHIQPTYSTITSTAASAAAAASPYLPKYYNRPVSDNLIFGEPDRDPWRLSAATLPAPAPPSYQYPIASSGGNAAAGKWYWMPNSAESMSPSVLALPTAAAVTAASPFATDVVQPQPNWRWMFDQKYTSGGGGSGGVTTTDVGPSGPEAFQRPTTADVLRGNEHPYSFDAPALHLFGMQKTQSPPRPFSSVSSSSSSGEEGGGLFATQITENEFNRLVKGSPAGAEQALELQPSAKPKPKEYVCMFQWSRLDRV